jgi:hypothetical protein
MARYCRADVHILVLNHFRRSGPQRRQVNNQNPTRSSIVFTSAFGPEALPHCVLSGHGVLLAKLSAFTPQICQRLGWISPTRKLSRPASSAPVSGPAARRMPTHRLTIRSHGSFSRAGAADARPEVCAADGDRRTAPRPEDAAS